MRAVNGNSIMGQEPLFLGIDTGGTYTDAAVWCETRGVVAKAKALTTRHDLAVGIAGAAGASIGKAGVRPGDIRLVSLSTTLATNALVEGQGGRAGLVMIGFGEADLARDGLATALGSDPVVFCRGGHDVHGNAAPLDLGPLEAVLPAWTGAVTGVAVCALFATRNPAHELAAAARIRAAGLPVTCSHELTPRLGGPRRALTTLLNARLVPMIARLVSATRGWLSDHGIDAPLTVVRGDGALVSAAFALERPIETILSGPAASLVGARALTGLDRAIVSDIGGTTTDIAILDGGRPRLDPDGATVGGWRTMVEAVAMRTHGLGGDSEVTLAADGLGRRIVLGPRRLLPLSLAAMAHGEAVHLHLDRQARAAHVHRFEGRFAVRTGLTDAESGAFTAPERRLLDRLGDGIAPLDTFIQFNPEAAVLDRLVARGVVHVAGFTPSDAAHVLGRQDNWDRAAAELGAALFARRKDGRGVALAPDGTAASALVLAAMTRRSAEVILEAAFAEDGLDGALTVAAPLVQRALDGGGGIARATLSLDRPVIGLGASAGLHYAGLDAFTGVDTVVPAHADVANAVGAVTGQVRIVVEAHVGQPSEGVFRLQAGTELADFASEDAAMAAARAAAARLARERAENAGAAEIRIELAEDIAAATIEGNRTFIEAVVRASAAGRPRIAA